MSGAAVTPLRAALLYAAVVFAAGFVLGTLRVLVLEPRFGRTVSVMAELPLMLAVSWAACRWTMRDVPQRAAERALAGAIAFGLLMGAEALLAVTLFGRPLSGFLSGLLHPVEIPGLLAQIAFGLFPLVEARFRRSG